MPSLSVERTNLQKEILRLKSELERAKGLSAEAKVAGLTALVNARATL
jgi:hypothetical protein